MSDQDHDRLRQLLADVESQVMVSVAEPGPQAAQLTHRRRVRRRVALAGLCTVIAAVLVGLTAWVAPRETPVAPSSPSPSATVEPTSSPALTPSAPAVGAPCTSTFDMVPVMQQSVPSVTLGVNSTSSLCPGYALKVTWALYRLEGDSRKLVSSKSLYVDQGTKTVTTLLPSGFCGDALAVFLVGDTGPVSTFSDSAMRSGSLPYSRWSKGKLQGMWDFVYAERPC